MNIRTFRELKVGQAFYFLSTYNMGTKEVRYKTSIHKYADRPKGPGRPPWNRETLVILIEEDE